jgi:predicted RNA polymerase sigma factor
VDALTSGGGERAAGPGQEATGPAAHAASVAARDSYGRLLALLSASASDIAAAEDALADAFERALRTWPGQGVPGNPDAWLLTVARNRLRDHWKSAHVQRAVPVGDELEAVVAGGPGVLAGGPGALDSPDAGAIPDRRLELMLVCAHPAIDRAVHAPLMLNTVLGFTAEQVGRAFSVPAPTMATRLVRAKKRIKAARIPFRIPGRSHLPARMTTVLEAVYGAYVIDWATTGPQDRPLPSEALHLAEVLTTLVPGDPEAHGLAALVQLSASRAPARLDAGGRFIPLPDQDPSLWDSRLIEAAHEHLRAAHARGQLGRFQLEAAIQAVHCARRQGGTTDWPALVSLHRTLDTIAPSLGSGVALAAATAQAEGPAAGLALLDALLRDSGQAASRFQPAHATRAHLLGQLGRSEEAVTAYDSAIGLTHDPAERQYLQHRRDHAARRGQRQEGRGRATGP